MALDGTIYITITDERGSGGGGATPKPTPTPKDVEKQAQENSDNNSALGEYARVSFYNFVNAQAQQFVNYAIGNIGNFTGDYNKQRQVQQMVTVGNTLKSIGMSVAAGVTMGGAVGGIIAGAIAVTTQAVNFAYSEYSNNFAVAKQNRELTQLRKLTGLDSLTNGSRI